MVVTPPAQCPVNVPHCAAELLTPTQNLKAEKERMAEAGTETKTELMRGKRRKGPDASGHERGEDLLLIKAVLCAISGSLGGEFDNNEIFA